MDTSKSSFVGQALSKSDRPELASAKVCAFFIFISNTKIYICNFFYLQKKKNYICIFLFTIKKVYFFIGNFLDSATGLNSRLLRCVLFYFLSWYNLSLEKSVNPVFV